MKTAQEVIEKLGLKPLPEEGGYYRETYRSDIMLPAKQFGIPSNSQRTAGTAILYLLEPKTFSALHRLRSDEIFHFYAGDPVEMLQITPEGELKKYVLGPDVFSGHEPQVVVPIGNWQGLRLKDGSAWTLLGTTVAPGFEFEDFEVGDRAKILGLFPQHECDVLRFTRAEGEVVHG